MTQISVERKHSLGREAARKKAESLLEILSRKHAFQASWEGDTLKVKRSGADGRIQIGDDSIKVDLKLGVMLSMLGGMIKSEIERALDKALT